MNKLCVVLVLVLATGLAFAKGSSHPSNEADSSAGVITSDVATDGWRTDRISRTAANETVVCPLGMKHEWRDSLCEDAAHRSAWVYPYQAVPAGKTYTGFRFVNGYLVPYIEIYWK